MSGDKQVGAVRLEREGAVAAAVDYGRSAESLSDVAAIIGRARDGVTVGDRYSELGAALTTGIESAGASIGRWSAASAAVADAVRTTVQASSEVDQSSADVMRGAGA